ncbi:MAG TPA: IS200/IS605 family transposase [Terriglobales bacterium]|nr:IS200/IS605 family transposase [Terriglobales bacterium]
MSHPYVRNYVHLIFGTRESRKLIKPPIEPELRKALKTVAVQYGIELIEVGAAEDHVHLLVCMPPKIGVAVAVRAFKADSAKQVNEAGHFFAWQQGYAAFSVSASNLDALTAYLREQLECHRSRTFDEEFRSFLIKHGIRASSATVTD